jgi:cell wall assembly regulator SMI1
MNTDIVFERSAPKLTQENISQAEKTMDVILPPQFVEHYLRQNGGVPSKSYVLNEDTEEYIEVSVFSPLHYKLQNSDGSTIEETYNDFKKRRIIPKNYLPFARDWGGNLFCICLDSQQIVFILMDMGAFTQECASVIAPSFDTFLAALVSEDEAED